MIFWRSWGNNHQHSGILTGACEIKWYRTIDASQLTGLRSFRLDYPDVRCHVVCNVDEPFLRGRPCDELETVSEQPVGEVVGGQRSGN